MRRGRPAPATAASCSPSIPSLQDECRFRAERQGHRTAGTDLLSTAMRVLCEDHQSSDVGLHDVLRCDADVGALEDTTGNPVGLRTVELNLFRPYAHLDVARRAIPSLELDAAVRRLDDAVARGPVDQVRDAEEAGDERRPGCLVELR